MRKCENDLKMYASTTIRSSYIKRLNQMSLIKERKNDIFILSHFLFYLFLHAVENKFYLKLSSIHSEPSSSNNNRVTKIISGIVFKRIYFLSYKCFEYYCEWTPSNIEYTSITIINHTHKTPHFTRSFVHRALLLIFTFYIL